MTVSWDSLTPIDDDDKKKKTASWDSLQPASNKPANNYQQTIDNAKPINEIPEAQDLYNKNNAWIGKAYSQEQINAWKSKGPIGFVEAFNKYDKTDAIPVTSGITSLAKTGSLAMLAHKASSGQELSDKDKEKLSNYMANEAEIQTRGYSLGGKFINGGLDTVPFVGEFILAALSAGAAAPELAAEEGAKITAKQGLKAATKNLIEKLATKEGALEIGKNALSTVGKNQKFLAPVLLPSFGRSVGGRFLSNGLAITDKGQVYAKQSDEAPATTILKAIGDAEIGAETELAGPLFAPAIGAVGNGVKRFMPSVLVGALDKLAETKGVQAASTLLKRGEKLGFHGFLEEMGENELQNVLSTTFDLDAEKGYSFDQFGKAIVPTWDDFLVQAGLIAIQGGMSTGALRLHDKLTSRGVNQNLINEVMQNTSELEKDDYLRQLDEQDGIPQKLKENHLTEQDREAIEKDFYDKAVDAGVDENQALSTSKLMGVFSKKFGSDGQKMKEWYNKLAFKNKPLEGGVSMDVPFDKLTSENIPEVKFQKDAAFAGVATKEEAPEAAKLWQEKGTDSPFFQKWFGDSKVVNNEGKPLVVYHGSMDKFNTFSTQERGRVEKSINTKNAFWFTDDDMAAEKFANIHRENKITNLSADKHTLGKGYNNPEVKQELNKQIEDLQYQAHERYNVYLAMKNPLEVDYDGQEYNTKSIDKLVKKAIKNGNDGLIIKNIDDEGGTSTQYAVFNPEQIKSENNQGNFSKDTGNIFYQKKPTERDYLGYFQEHQDKNIIGIMENANPSTLVHEMGHLFLQGLNEFAKTDNEAKAALKEVNDWLGYAGSAYELEQKAKGNFDTKPDYTVEQHEKFARGFEAYLYNGKAPSNGLRQVFENFKEWLSSIYKHVDDLGIKLTPDVQKVFDNIFSEKSQTNDKGQQVKDIVENAKNIGLGNKLTDVQERHKEVAYHILSVALGKNKQWLKTILESDSDNPKILKSKENIQFALEHTDDKISGSDGFLPEWTEFFSDPNLYQGNDYELAQAAYDTIVDKTYKTIDNEYEFLDKTEAQYQYLVNQFKKSSDRDVPLAAFWDWIESVEPEFVEIYADKYEKDVAYIERFENMDKFEQAKETILKASREANTPNSLAKYREIAIATMDSLKFLTPRDKAKLTANILRYETDYALERQIDEILDVAKTMEDIRFKMKMMDKVHEELQGTKNLKQSNKTVGRYDYTTNKIFEKLREIEGLTQEQVNEMRLDLNINETAEENGLSFENKIINAFINYKANGIAYTSTEAAKVMYDDIAKMKIAGREAKNGIEFEKKLNDARDIDELVDILDKKKNAKWTTKVYVDCIANWESALNALFNKSIKEKYSLLKAERDAEVWVNNQKNDFEKKVAEIYGLKDWNFDYKIIQNLTEKYTFLENVEDRQVNKEMNKMEILLAWMWDYNEVLHERLANQFGHMQLTEMFSKLTQEDKELGNLMMRTVNSFYPKANEAFIKKYGIDLPRVEHYFPSKVERISELDLLNDFTSKSTSPSFVKTRSGGVNLLMDFSNPVKMLYSHIDGMGKFINMTETLDVQNKIFKSPLVKRLVSEKYGELAYKTLLQSLANSSYKQNAKIYNGVEQAVGGLIQNWISGNVAFKPSIGIKQFLTACNYSSEMPMAKWAVGFVKALAQPKKTIEFMKKIPYLEARFESGGQNEFLKDTIANSAFSTSKKLKDFFTLNIRLGDIGSIAFGGRPYLEYLMKEKGMSEEDAVNEFINHTQRTMQASETSSLSNVQISMNHNMLAKMLTAYQNAQFQYLRMAGDSIVSYANGDMTKGQMAKNLFVYMYLNPLLYRSATSLSFLTALLTGDLDDLKDDLIGSIFDLNASCIALFGNVYQYAVEKMLGESSMPEKVPLQGDLMDEINKISGDDVSLEDYLHFAGYGTQVFSGIPVNAVGASLSGAGDIAQGNYVKGGLKVLGWSDKRAAHAVGDGE